VNDTARADPLSSRELLTQRKRFSPYPTYNPSGIEWLGDIPAHWVTPPVYTRYVVELGKMLDERRITGDYLLRYLRNVDVQWDRIDSIELPEMDIHPSERERFTVKQGDLLVCEGGEVGRAAIVTKSEMGLGYQKALHRLRPLGNREVPRFMFFTLVWAASTGVFLAGGNPNTIPHLTGEKLRRYRFPAPPTPEQRAIAGFLDGETSKIDSLVSKKRELVKRLKEKRLALTSRTVTKGLPPHEARAAGLNPVPTCRSTGVDWFGEVPAHWPKPCKLSLLASPQKHSFVNGPFGSDLLTSELVDDGIPVVYIRDISKGHYRRVSDVCVTPEKERAINFCRVDPGDVLIAKVGDPPGAAAVYPQGEPSGIVTQDVIRIRVNQSKVSAKYLVYFLNSTAGQALIDSIAIEATRTRVSLADYKNSLCLLPPRDEQDLIVEFLDRNTAHIDQMIGNVQAAVERLEEYRIALITAAVTGKIDVRGISS